MTNFEILHLHFSSLNCVVLNGTHTVHTLRFLPWLIYLSLVHQLSGPGDDIMCDISPWPLIPQCSFPAWNQTLLPRHNSILTYHDLSPQSLSPSLLKHTSGRQKAPGAGMAMCVSPVALWHGSVTLTSHAAQNFPALFTQMAKQLRMCNSIYKRIMFQVYTSHKQWGRSYVLKCNT